MTPRRKLTREMYGRRVFVYRNLHRGCWSIRDEQTRRVIAHSEGPFYLADTVFKVSEAGRQRVIREKRKNVHAGVQGYLAHPEGGILEEKNLGQEVKVTYNPYKTSGFKAEGALVESAEVVRFGEDGCFLVESA